MSATTAGIPGAGRELDVLVAEKVFGFTRIGTFDPTCDFGANERGPINHVTDGQRHFRLPLYSTDVAAAWLVVDHMSRHPEPEFRTLTLRAYSYGRTYAAFSYDAWEDGDSPLLVEANGEHATPLAICLAALAALRSPGGPEKASEGEPRRITGEDVRAAERSVIAGGATRLDHYARIASILNELVAADHTPAGSEGERTT